MFVDLKKTFAVLLIVGVGAGSIYFVREWALSQLESSDTETSESAETSDEISPSKTKPSKPSDDVKEETSAPGKIVTVVVSSDMGSGGDCHDHYTDGCDLFSAQVDLSTGEVTNVKQITNNDVADINPVLSQDGTKVYYTETTGNEDAAMEISIDGGTSRVLAKAANRPFPTPDGEGVYFTLKKSSLMAFLDLTDSDGVFQELKTLVSTHEPEVSSRGFVGFYRSTPGSGRGSNTSQAMVYIPSTGETVEVSPADGTAHCFWNYDGSVLYCNNTGGGAGGILSFPVSEEGVVGESSVAIRFPTVATLGAVDSEFDKECVMSSVFYGSFCDETRVLLTAGCYTANTVDGEREQEFTQTMLLDIESGEYLPVGANMVEAYGSEGGTTWEGACME